MFGAGKHTYRMGLGGGKDVLCVVVFLLYKVETGRRIEWLPVAELFVLFVHIVLGVGV